MTIPAFLPTYVLAGSIGIVAALLVGIVRALDTTSGSAREPSIVLRVSGLLLGLWFLVAIVVAALGTYDASTDRIPNIQYGILVPILLGASAIFRVPAVARAIDAVPQHWLVGVQLYRVLGGIFLVLHGTGRMPGLFAWPAGLGDVLVGILAPVVAIAYARAPRHSAGLVVAWNILGLLDLVVAVMTGFLTSPSRFQLLAFDLPNELVSRFPLVLVPTFLVPLSVLLHLASLAKLRREAARDEVRGATARTPA